MILVWGIGQDTTTASVLDELERRGAAVRFVDQRQLLGADILTTDIELDVADGVRATLVRGEDRTDLSDITAAFIRPYDSRAFPIPARSPGGPAWCRALALDDLLWMWADIAPGQVVNRPGDMASNGSKPFQAMQIQQAGFAVPETLVTTDPNAAAEFWDRHGQVIFKSVSGVRSIVSRLRPEDQQRWGDIASCPVQFQQYVPGVDFRVHVVAQEVFTARIDSDCDDYRYASRRGGTADLSLDELPDDVAERCLLLTKSLGLSVSGIDLRRTVEGDWVCFEANPSPAFSYFDLDGSITAAVADLLMHDDSVLDPNAARTSDERLANGSAPAGPQDSPC